MQAYDWPVLPMTRGGALLALLAVACGPRVLPPRTPPSREAPVIAAPNAPMSPGHARVYLDSADARLEVSLVKGAERTTILTPTHTYVGGGIVAIGGLREVAANRLKLQPLCFTPCYADLPRGPIQLQLAELESGKSELVVLDLAQEKLAYRHAIGHSNKSELGKVLGAGSVLGLGIALLTTGPLLLLVDERPAGIAFMVGGGVITAAGALLLSIVRPEEQRGSGTLWGL